mgnify:FL=1
MKKAIDFNQSGFNSHIEDVYKAETLLLKLIDEFSNLVGAEPEELQAFLNDPFVYTGELVTEGIKIEGMDLSLDKRLFLKDVNLQSLQDTYEELKNQVKVAELTLLDFDNDFKVKESVKKEIETTYTTYAVTKAEKDFHKRLEALADAYNEVHRYLQEKGLTPNVNGFLIGRNDLKGIRVNTQAFRLVSRALNRS